MRTVRVRIVVGRRRSILRSRLTVLVAVQRLDIPFCAHGRQTRNRGFRRIGHDLQQRQQCLDHIRRRPIRKLRQEIREYIHHVHNVRGIAQRRARIRRGDEE